MFFLVLAFFIFYFALLYLLPTLLLAIFGNATSLINNVTQSYYTHSDMIAITWFLFILGAAAVERQEPFMNTLSEIYECTIYEIAYGATNDDFAGPAWAILARDLYKFIAPKYNAVWSYWIEGLQTMADKFLDIIPVNFGDFSDTWEAICAVWDFVIHVFRTPHSDEVPEIEIPQFTDPILDFIIDVVTCWLNFIKNFVFSMSEVFFTGTCGPECTALSEEMCNCTKLSFQVIAFVPANGGIFKEYIDALIDVGCCFQDLVINTARSLAGGTFFADCDQLILDFLDPGLI